MQRKHHQKKPLMTSAISRRRFALGIATSSVLGTLASQNHAQSTFLASQDLDTPGASLLPWKPGQLDIHHLATGRGSATLVVMPDGTTLLIDTGASNSGLDVSFEARPSAQMRPGQWVARYVQRRLKEIGSRGLNYLLVTHNHPDHVGDVNPASPASSHGDYRLTGVMDVAEMIPVQTWIDRDFPDYDYPMTWTTPWALNYFAFIRARRSARLPIEKFMVGSASQIEQRGNFVKRSGFSVRNLAANGVIWTGDGAQTKGLFPPLDSLPKADHPNENHCSAAIRVQYGDFSYYTGGDLTSYTHDGALPWQDMLGAISEVTGPVTVATADHHGLFDSLSADVVRRFRPKAWVIPTWHISHPDLLQVERMLSERLYPGPRDVFATSVMRENVLANRRLMLRLQSIDGHIVVRVPPDGTSFTTTVTDSKDEKDIVKLVRGPTPCA